MKRRTFLKSASLAAGAATVAYPSLAAEQPVAMEKGIHELRIYHISRGGNNKGLLVNYFRDAYIPFLKKFNASVHLYDEYSQEEPVKVYCVISYPSPAVYLQAQQAIANDTDYMAATKSYNEIPLTTPVFTRYETFLLEAFDKFPAFVEPAAGKGLFELRIYESPSEEAGRKKVQMFNNEEIDVFLKYGLEPVFFGKIIAGNFMPALIYMVGLTDMPAREPSWAKFNNSPGWATMRVKPEYANIVSNIRRLFLTPLKVS